MLNTSPDALSPSDHDVVVSATGGVVTLLLNRPHRGNALTVGMMEQLRCAIEAAGADPEARVIVITGAGNRAFCSGADLAPDATPFAPDFTEATLPFANLLRAGKASKLPIISMVNGACVAGGMGLLGISDLAFASTEARFGMPEVKIGLFPLQIVAVLRDLIPPRLMADMCFTGRLIPAHEALAAGLVNELVEPGQLGEVVREAAQSICDVSPIAVRRGKYTLAAMASMSFDQMIAFAEAQIRPMLMTRDAREGILAFNEKRKPQWPVS